jgi:hypothetical protein
MTKEYVIIDKTLLEKRIKELEKEKKIMWWIERDTIIEILYQSTPLIPEIEKAFNAGSERGEHGYGNANNKQNYISNLKLDI